MRLLPNVIAFALVAALLNACAPPEPGTPAWCEELSNRPRLEWTAEEVIGHVSDCVLGESNVSDE